MNHFWRALFDQLKDCGRNGAVFYAALVIGFGLLLIFSWLLHISPDQFLLYGLPLSIVGAATWFLASMRATLLRNRQHLESNPLSSDEISKARSKLVRQGDK